MIHQAADVRAMLNAPSLPARLQQLGFAADDAADTADSARAALADETSVRETGELAQLLVGRLGDLGSDGNGVWEHPAATSDRLGVGVLPLLAMVVAADQVAGYHQSRGVPQEVSARTLSDLGQQARVHRVAYGTFGLHTYDWLRLAWTGNLYWLGRLQFNFRRVDNEWTLSTHIPRTGPLTPESVDDALAQARTFFPQIFPECDISGFHCFSWLLGPEIAAAVPARSNIAQFQHRWSLQPHPVESDDDTVFFTFGRRNVTDFTQLPQDTTLERAVVRRLRSGGHWHTYGGVMPFQTESAPGP